MNTMNTMTTMSAMKRVKQVIRIIKAAIFKRKPRSQPVNPFSQIIEMTENPNGVWVKAVKK